MNDNYFGYERICPVCGKLFMTHEEWGFIRNAERHDMYFCSWKCVRKYDSEHNAKKGRKPNECADEIRRLRDMGYSRKETSEKLGVPISTVKYYFER